MARRNRKNQRARQRKRKAAERRGAAINAALDLDTDSGDSGSAPEAAQTLRNMIGFKTRPAACMTLEEQLAAAASHGVEPELGMAAHRLFGPDGPEPDDPLTPEQLQDVHSIFDIMAPVQPESEEPEPEPLSCQICYKPYGPFERPCGHVTQVRAFPEWDWQERGCVCPTVEICLECVQKEAFESAKRCCVNPLCKGIVMKCPWCREDVNIGDLFYKWVLANGDEESQRRARATLAQEGLM